MATVQAAYSYAQVLMGVGQALASGTSAGLLTGAGSAMMMTGNPDVAAAGAAFTMVGKSTR